MVIDTHVLVWWLAQPDRLSPAASRLLDAAIDQGPPVLLSSITAWEIAMLCARGRLDLGEPPERWLADCEALPFLRFVPVDNRIAVRSVSLRDLHRDPADRLIMATAMEHGVPLLTADRRLRAWDGHQVVW